MSLHHRKRFARLAFLSLLLICSQAAAAQNENRRQAALTASDSGKIETPAPEHRFFWQNDVDGDDDAVLTEAVTPRFDTTRKPKIADVKYNFPALTRNEKHFEFSDAADDKSKKISFFAKPAPARISDDPKDEAATDAADDSFRWRAAIGQSLMFLGVQHGYSLTQAKTRRALRKGGFFRDYVNSVKCLGGWEDGGRFFTNYIAHPMQGALTGFIYIQNQPKERSLEFGKSAAYWRSRMTALAWSAAWSMQFELGPVSQASIGNVGLSGKQTWIDIVITPTVGTTMLVAEDAIDRFVMKGIERRTNNFYLKIFMRMLLSPTRNFSNLLRFKAPWYRDRPTVKEEF
jgi:hypothetical protein